MNIFEIYSTKEEIENNLNEFIKFLNVEKAVKTYTTFETDNNVVVKKDEVYLCKCTSNNGYLYF